MGGVNPFRPSNPDLPLTLGAIVAQDWTVVLLAPGAKFLEPGSRWESSVTSDPAVVLRHLQRGGGVGIDAYASRVAVLDFDVQGAAGEMCEELGPLPPTSTSPSGGFHVYVQAVPDLPAVINWRGTRVGEVLRGPRQQAVMPPSPYPGNRKRGVPAGGHYRWLRSPSEPIPVLSQEWRQHLVGLPSYIEREPIGIPPEEPWDGPPPEEILRRAMLQPGARRRARGVKFQCPGCRSEGHDRHFDNATVFADGRWGCALDPEHKRDIGVALGIFSDDYLSFASIERAFLRGALK